MMRRARSGDQAAIDAFLARDPARSMFLRGNLALHGLGPGAHPHATTFHLWPDVVDLAGVLGLTQSSMVLASGAPSPAFVRAAAATLAGQRLAGFTGDATLTGALIDAVALPPTAFRLNHIEPLYTLDLALLAQPDASALRPAKPDELALLTGWFTTYMQETGLGTGDPTAGIAEAQDRAQSALAGGPLRLLVQDGQPVAMASFNARAGAAVQVGGVFVPGPLRNRGLGRRVTCALLAQARAEGAELAVLFADNPAAARAYEAIGFARVGQYRIAFLHPPESPPCP